MTKMEQAIGALKWLRRASLLPLIVFLVLYQRGLMFLLMWVDPEGACNCMDIMRSDVEVLAERADVEWHKQRARP